MTPAVLSTPLRMAVGGHTVDLVMGNAHAGTTAWLSPDEELRAKRFRYEPNRQRFIARRLALRAVVAAELGSNPASVRFSHGPHGRPEVNDDSRVSFSSSSAGDTFVIATCRSATVGVDAVTITSGMFDRSTAAVVFHPAELEQVVASADRDAAFAVLWARKEAFAKADGRGLGGYVKTIDLSGVSPRRHADTTVADVIFGVDETRGLAAAVAVRPALVAEDGPDPG